VAQVFQNSSGNVFENILLISKYLVDVNGPGGAVGVRTVYETFGFDVVATQNQKSLRRPSDVSKRPVTPSGSAVASGWREGRNSWESENIKISHLMLKITTVNLVYKIFSILHINQRKRRK
jgi:hypothetical protein